MAAIARIGCSANLVRTTGVSSGRLGGMIFARRCIPYHSKGTRELSSAPMVHVEQQGEFSIVKMSRPPVNSFNLEFLQQLNLVLEDLENEASCRGFILASDTPNIFSAGLDLKQELYHPKEERLRSFWYQFQEFWIRLYGSKLVGIAAVNGHAIAGGCVAALACDYRVMGSGFKMGLTETKVGLALPPMVADTVLNTVGHRRAELVGQLGTLFSSDQALEMKMVDKVVDPELVMDQAKQEMEKWLEVPDIARSTVKRHLRQEFLRRLQDRRDEDIRDFVSLVMSDTTQKTLDNYIAGLKKNKSSTK